METMAVWQQWCRICGNFESAVKIENTPEIVDFVEKVLSIPTFDIIKICNDCNCFLNEISQFVTKSKDIQKMFLELNCTDEDESEYLNEIREKFGLKKLPSTVDDCEFVDQDRHEVIIKEELDGVDVKDEFEDNSENESEPMESDEVLHNESQEILEEEEEEEYEDERELRMTKKLKKKRRRRQKEIEKESDEQDPNSNFDFTCHVCKEQFSLMTHLVRHCKLTHDQSPKVSCVCGQILGTYRLFQLHRRMHFLESHLKCEFCKLTFIKQICLDKHIERKHSENAKKFVCSQCGGNFRDTFALKRHEMTHLPDEIKKTEECSYCSNKFVSKSSLAKHINSIHTKKDWWICSTCGKSFTSRGNLRSHLVVHQADKSFECEHCNAKFKSKGSLRCHRTIHGEKNFNCKICGTKFRTNALLSLHMVRHSDEKKYKCPVENCPNEYKRSDALKIHLCTHTGQKPFQCLFCERAFNNNPNRRKHTLRDHPEELAIYEANKQKQQELQN